MSTPKVLIYDLENSPNISYTWGKWEQDVIAFKKEWHLLSFAAKWLGKDGVIVKALPDYKSYRKDKDNDKELVEDLHKLFSEADILIAHNGDRFDQKKSNAKFIEHGFPPPKPYKTVDTLKVARKYFSFNSNKLDDLGNILGVGRKVKTGGFDLWLGCLEGNPKSWALMKKYNKQDVLLLERIYLKLLPWIENHPNISVLSDVKNGCPNCGSQHIQSRGLGITRSGTYHRYQCVDCGAWSKGSSQKLTNIT